MVQNLCNTGMDKGPYIMGYRLRGEGQTEGDNSL